jgi:NlpC/P60 family putative phage cell wall peptidase
MEIDHSRGDAESRRALPPRSGGSTAEGGEGGGATVRHLPPPPRCARSPSPASQGRNHDDRIVQIARTWIGTPYVHQASLKGVGCDCLGLLRGVWRELYGEEPEDVPPYSPDWAEATGAETLYMALKRHAREIAIRELAPGDVALFRMSGFSGATASLHERGRAPAKHCGVIGSLPPPERGRSIREADRVGVIVAFRSMIPPRIACAIRPSLFKGGNLTLIHARQNKRVSEEPLSPFWRSKLAYAFRL